jgi:hypothetical protein
MIRMHGINMWICQNARIRGDKSAAMRPRLGDQHAVRRVLVKSAWKTACVYCRCRLQREYVNARIRTGLFKPSVQCTGEAQPAVYVQHGYFSTGNGAHANALGGTAVQRFKA